MRKPVSRELSPLPQDYPKLWLLAHLSLTRFLIDHLKEGNDARDTGWWLRLWNWCWCLAECGLALTWCLLEAVPESWPAGIRVLFGVVAVWRINEVAYAFYSDGISRLRGIPPRSDIQGFERVGMLLRSACGLVVQFAVLYFLLDATSFKQHFVDFRDALYFSAATTTSIGQEGQEVQGYIARFLHIYQSALGILLFALALSIYAGGVESREAT